MEFLNFKHLKFIFSNFQIDTFSRTINELICFPDDRNLLIERSDNKNANKGETNFRDAVTKMRERTVKIFQEIMKKKKDSRNHREGRGPVFFFAPFDLFSARSGKLNQAR